MFSGKDRALSPVLSKHTVTHVLLVALTLGLAMVPAGSARAQGIEQLLQQMSLEEKVGQLFVVAVAGDRVDTDDPTDVAANRNWYGLDNAAQVIEKYHVGGFAYFSAVGDHALNNLKTPQQIAALSNGIQRTAQKQRTPIPMLISTDQEPGGYIVRVGPPATQLPSNMGLAASPHRHTDTQTAAYITGRELKAMGINQNLAPVADVNSNPANPVIHVRSFGDDPAAVSELATRQITAFQNEAGIVATAKHFPGHGDTHDDSHVNLPVMDHDRDRLEAIELPPFKAAIDAGVGSIMTAHIVVPALDPSGDPASLSRPIITGVLREKLGYDGVVITDALNMQGAREKYSDDRIPVVALKAGADQLLMPQSLDVAYNAVLNAVRNGELTENRIDLSVSRILKLKERYGLFASPQVDETAVPSEVGTAEHLGTATDVTNRTVTLIKNDTGLLPLAPGANKILVTGWGTATAASLAAAVTEHGSSTTTTTHPTGNNPTHNDIKAAETLARDHDIVVVMTMNAGQPQNIGQRDLVKALLATGKPVAVVAVLDPYDIAYLPGTTTHLATYSYAASSLQALAKVIFGKVNPSGRLPVAIPNPEQPGTTLYPRGHHVSYSQTPHQ